MDLVLIPTSGASRVECSLVFYPTLQEKPTSYLCGQHRLCNHSLRLLWMVPWALPVSRRDFNHIHNVKHRSDTRGCSRFTHWRDDDNREAVSPVLQQNGGDCCLGVWLQVCPASDERSGSSKRRDSVVNLSMVVSTPFDGRWVFDPLRARTKGWSSFDPECLLIEH